MPRRLPGGMLDGVVRDGGVRAMRLYVGEQQLESPQLFLLFQFNQLLFVFLLKFPFQ